MISQTVRVKEGVRLGRFDLTINAAVEHSMLGCGVLINQYLLNNFGRTLQYQQNWLKNNTFHRLDIFPGVEARVSVSINAEFFDWTIDTGNAAVPVFLLDKNRRIMQQLE